MTEVHTYLNIYHGDCNWDCDNQDLPSYCTHDQYSCDNLNTASNHKCHGVRSFSIFWQSTVRTDETWCLQYSVQRDFPRRRDHTDSDYKDQSFACRSFPIFWQSTVRTDETWCLQYSVCPTRLSARRDHTDSDYKGPLNHFATPLTQLFRIMPVNSSFVQSRIPTEVDVSMAS